MGLDNRDYARDGRYSNAVGGGSGFSSTPSIVKYLIGANILLYMLQFLITRPGTLEDFNIPPEIEEVWTREELERTLAAERISVVEEWLQQDTEKVIGSGQVWRLLTAAFLHSRGDYLHIIFNMLFLFWFGPTLEGMYGRREFLLFYLASAFIASCADVGLDLITGMRGTALGASGAIMGIMMLYAIHYPRQKILLFFIIPVEIRWVVAGYVFFDLYPVLMSLLGKRDLSGVGHAAHLGGLAFGFLYWKFALRLERLLPKRKPQTRPIERGRSLLDPPSAEPDELDEKVDAILKKITEEGEASLTDSEREILNEAAKRRR